MLVISPAFHGYWRSIERALESTGHEVATHVYDSFVSPLEKLRNKVLYELPDRLGRDEGARRFAHDATLAAVAAVRMHKPDVVLAVKSDVFEAALWDEVDQAGARTVLWLYDELRRTRHEPDALRRFHAVASYSRDDVRSLSEGGLNAHHVALAFDPAYQRPPIHSDEVVFVGARYAGRERLLEQLHGSGVPVRAFGRDWSHRPFDRVRTWQWKRPDVPWGAELSHSECCARMAGGLATLNVHGDQDGFTMRTFEAAGVGGLQLIDRSDVTEFYDDGTEVLSFSSADEIVEFVDRARSDRAWADAIREAGRKRTLAEHTFEHRAKQLVALWD